MSKMIPVHNSGKMVMYVAATMIPPGETLHFPEHHVPEHLRPSAKAAEVEIENPLQVLLANSIKVVSEALPSLSDEQLDELELMEVAGDDRSGMANAIQEDRLRRADSALNETGSVAPEKQQTGVDKYIEENKIDVTK